MHIFSHVGTEIDGEELNKLFLIRRNSDVTFTGIHFTRARRINGAALFVDTSKVRVRLRVRG